MLALSFILGAIRCTHTWDWPTYLLLTLAALGVQQWARLGPHPRPLSQIGRGGLWVGLRFVAVFFLCGWLFQPYHDHFVLFYSQLEPWTGERTTLNDYLLVNGVFLFVIVSWLAYLALGRGSLLGGVLRAALRGRSPGRYMQLARVVSRGRSQWDGLELMGVTAVLIAALALVVAGLPLFGVLLPVIVLAGFLFLRPGTSPTTRLVLLMVIMGLGISWGVDLVVVSPDIGRMNTVFRFYLQLWVLWGIVSAVGLATLFQWRPQRSRKIGLIVIRAVWGALLVVLLFCGLLYAPTSTRGKIEDRFVKTPPTLDGMAFMREAVWQTAWRTPGDRDIFAPKEHNYAVELVWDYQAIQWLQDNVDGSPVVLEAVSDGLYRWNSRVSIYTGLPDVVGWDWHEQQQLGTYAPQVNQRVADVYAIYSEDDVPRTLELLRKYHVKYIYVGDLERIYYDARGLDKLAAMNEVYLDVVYSNPHVTIYQVRDWQP